MAKRRRKKRSKNIKTSTAILIGVGVLVGVPLVFLTVGAIMVGKVAGKAMDDMDRPLVPTSPGFPTQPAMF